MLRSQIQLLQQHRMMITHTLTSRSLYSLSVLVFALRVCLAQQLPLFPDDWANDFAFSGNRQIWRCNKDEQDGYAAQIKSLLEEIDRDLPTILGEANRGTDSPYGFSTWFKTNENIEAVTRELMEVQQAPDVPIMVTIAPDKTPAIPHIPLTFVCINEDDQIFKPYYDYCMQRNGDLKTTGYSIWGTQLVIICPYFWDYSRLPAPELCPRVDTKGKFRAAAALGWNQYGLLMQQMIEKYLHESKGGLDEVYTAQSMINLPAEKQIDNPGNYDMFASCKISKFAA